MAAGYGISRLIEKEDRRPVDDPGGDRELPLHPAGVGRELAPAHLGQAELLQKLSRPRLALPAAHAVERRTKTEVLGAVQLRIKIALIGHDAHEMLDSFHVAGYIVAKEADRAAGWPGQAGEHVDRCGLSGAVGAEKAEDLAFADVKVHGVHCQDVAKPLGEAVRVDGGRILIHLWGLARLG